MKEFADDNFKFDETGSKFSKRVKTLWEKGAPQSTKADLNQNFLLCIFRAISKDNLPHC